MIFRRNRLLLAILVSSVFMMLLFSRVDLRELDLSRFQPVYAILAVMAYCCCILVRGTNLRELAGIERRDQLQNWMKLAARHQFLFSLAPSGVGDLGFPALARHQIGLDVKSSVRLIALVRLRDAFALAVIAIAGLVVAAFHYHYLIPLLIAGAVLLYFLDDIVANISSLFATKFPSSKLKEFLSELPDSSHFSWKRRTWRLFLTASSWLLALLGMFLAFLSVGKLLSLGELLLMLATLNLIGALAISIAGFGVAETGVAGVLVAFGDTVPEAAATALTARPILLVCVLVACGLIDASLSCSERYFNANAKR